MAPGLDKAFGRFNDELGVERPALYRLLAEHLRSQLPALGNQDEAKVETRRSVSQPTRRPQRGLPDLFAFTGPTGNWQLWS
jgi:hypothetical protein